MSKIQYHEKKILFFPVILFSIYSFSQDIGYTTTDIGAEYKWYKDGNYYGLHVASNAKLHHSIHGTIGYYSAKDDISSYYNNNNKSGIGLGLGYRYFTKLRPDGFFIGTQANLFFNKVTLTTQVPETYTSKVFIPSLKTGYMGLINDLFFITPEISFGYQTNLESKLKAEGGKTVFVFGISTGFKF